MRVGRIHEDAAQAEALARSLVKTAQGAGCMTSALITDMSQPLATAAGNALEVIEVMETLTGTSVNTALWDVTVALGGEALALAGLAGCGGWRGPDCAGAGIGRRGGMFWPDGRGAGRACGFRRPLAGPAALGPGDGRGPALAARRLRHRD
jgi:hypothetical protein